MRDSRSNEQFALSPSMRRTRSVIRTPAIQMRLRLWFEWRIAIRDDLLPNTPPSLDSESPIPLAFQFEDVERQPGASG